HAAPPGRGLRGSQALAAATAAGSQLSSLIGPPWFRSIHLGFGRTGDRRAIALLARPVRSSVSSARPGGPGHPDWQQGYAPSSAAQLGTGSGVPDPPGGSPLVGQRGRNAG